MSNETPNNDPLEFMKGMWGNMGFSLPGMVAPTFDTEELEKRIADLKAVEGWLRMNLSMLQMTIQGLEMQHSTLAAVKAMGQMAAESMESRDSSAAADAQAPEGGNAFAQASMWPWNMMQQMQAHMQSESESESESDSAKAQADEAAPSDNGKRPGRKTKKQ